MYEINKRNIHIGIQVHVLAHSIVYLVVNLDWNHFAHHSSISRYEVASCYYITSFVTFIIFILLPLIVFCYTRVIIKVVYSILFSFSIFLIISLLQPIETLSTQIISLNIEPALNL